MPKTPDWQQFEIGVFELVDLKQTGAIPEIPQDNCYIPEISAHFRIHWHPRGYYTRYLQFDSPQALTAYLLKYGKD